MRRNRHAHGLYDNLFREFVGLYRRNRKAYARLNGELASMG